MVARKAVKELEAKEFGERYLCDRLTAAVLSNTYGYIVKHVCTGLLKGAFSIILREYYDFAATLSGPPHLNYPMIGVSDTLLVFIGTMPYAVKNVVEEYGLENIEPGDVLLCNDPFRTGNHIMDSCFIRPVFYQGKIVAFVNLKAHMVDMGGPVPLGFNAESRNIYETGIVIPPSLIYKKDKPYLPTWKLHFDNTRFGDILLPDFKTIYENLKLGERLVIDAIEKYGLEAFWGAMQYACDTSEDAMAAGIARLPDGVFEADELVDADGVDDSEEYRIRCKIVKKGDRLEVDLSGTSRQARTCINASSLDSQTAVVSSLKCLTDPKGVVNSGSFRNIDVVVPEGSLLASLPPDGPTVMYYETTGVLFRAIWKALKDALGADAFGGDFAGSHAVHTANGLFPDGRPWFTIGQLGGECGPWAGSRVADGDNWLNGNHNNGMQSPTETVEVDTPAVMLRCEYVTDSGGPGVNRGGCSACKDSLWLLPAEHRSTPMHLKLASGFGVNGGSDGKAGGVWRFDPEVWPKYKDSQAQIPTDASVYRESIPVAGMIDPESKFQDPNGKYVWPWSVRGGIRTGGNAVFRYITDAGGGWGEPFQRDPERVLRDVRDEYVSIEGARRDYGVVIAGTDDPHREPEKLKVDHAATQAIRAARRSPSASTAGHSNA